MNSREDEAENQISDMECKEAKNNQSEQQKEKRILKNEDSIRIFWDDFKHTNIFIIGVGGDRRRREQEIGNLFEK